ncbi:MAG: 6-phospho-beta-glucosidase [Firmicutes bacterium]|nr:6-phospho-beta-glucosidase [Bacillota bacterium]
MRNLKIAVIGSGSTYTPELVSGFISRSGSLKADSFYMMDIDERKNAIVSSLAERMIEAAGLGSRLVVTDDLDEALEGADYAVAQVRVGRLPARVVDEKIPIKYGLLGQETTGVGGFFKALRTIPVIENAARTMERVAPKGWLINFSNPSGIIAQMLSETTSVRFAGLCNGPVNTERFLRSLFPEGTSLDYDFVGLNHLNWFTGVYADGADALPGLLADERVRKVTGLDYGEPLMKAIGGIPCGYMNYYYFRDETAERCKAAEKSRGQVCMEIEEELLTLYQDPSLKEKPALLDKRGGALYSEAAVSLIDALENDRNSVHVVNVDHKGTIPFLDAGDVAEVKCAVGKNGIVPLPLRNGNVSGHIAGLMRAVKAYEKLTVKAGLTGDYEAGLSALLTHPLVGDYAKAKAVYDEMLLAHKAYLARFAYKKQ